MQLLNLRSGTLAPCETACPRFGWLTGCVWLIILAGIFLICAEPAMASGRVREPESGQPYMLRQFAQVYGFPAPTIEGNVVTFRNEYTELTFELNSRRIRVNGAVVWLHEPILAGRRDWQIAAVDIEHVVDPLLRPNRALAKVGFQRIMIDPGHGGTDPGARGELGTVEKDLVLEISLRVAELLRRAGNEVHLTRARDEFISLSNRVDRAKEIEADLFVSIHFNSAANREAKGTETFVLPAAGFPGTSDQAVHPPPPRLPGNAFDPGSQLLAYAIQRNVLKRTGNEDRGIKRARFYVLREAPCPAVLFEGAFLSNPGDARNLHRPEYKEQMARGIAEGIIDYLGWVLRARLENVL